MSKLEKKIKRIKKKKVKSEIDKKKEKFLFFCKTGNHEKIEKLDFISETTPSYKINEYRLSDGKNGLYLACENGHLNIVQLLLKKGASVNVGLCLEYGNNFQNRLTKTPLYVAAEKGNEELVSFLTNTDGISINKGYLFEKVNDDRPNEFESPLHIACKNTFYNIAIEILCKLEKIPLDNKRNPPCKYTSDLNILEAINAFEKGKEEFVKFVTCKPKKF